MRLLMLILCTTGSAAMAVDGKLGADGPPLAYRLEDVTVRVLRQPGHGQPASRLSFHGQGQASLQVGDKMRPFDHAAADLVKVLNVLYRMHFFEMPAQMGHALSVFLKEDGTVGTQALKMSDAGSTTVCFSLPRYEKCVRYAVNGPRELEDFVQRLLADADQRAGPAK